MTNADRIRRMSDGELEAWYLQNCAARASNSCSGCKYDRLECSFGKWLKAGEGTRRGKWLPLVSGDYCCDQCHYGYSVKHNYCPHCGSQMEA